MGAISRAVKAGWAKANHNEDADYEPFTLFEAGSGEGEAKWLISDDEREHYFGVYRITEPPPAGSGDYELSLDDHLVVLEGELVIDFLPDGERLTLGVGDVAFIPGGSKIRLEFTKLPFKEACVLSRPAGT
jgi:mannose-6-phosphate isomerase-like protein (cupin superfamily)